LNIDGEQLGSAGLIEIIKNIDKSKSPINSIKNQIITFTSERFDDDISFVMIESQR